jgi:hypothetical protein
MSNDIIIGWCGAGSFYAMAEKKYLWSALNLAVAVAIAIWR